MMPELFSLIAVAVVCGTLVFLNRKQSIINQDGSHPVDLTVFKKPSRKPRIVHMTEEREADLEEKRSK